MPIEVIYVITLGIVVLYLTTIPSKRLRKSYQQFSFELDFQLSNPYIPFAPMKMSGNYKGQSIIIKPFTYLDNDAKKLYGTRTTFQNTKDFPSLFIKSKKDFPRISNNLDLRKNPHPELESEEKYEYGSTSETFIRELFNSSISTELKSIQPSIKGLIQKRGETLVYDFAEKISYPYNTDEFLINISFIISLFTELRKSNNLLPLNPCHFLINMPISINGFFRVPSQ